MAALIGWPALVTVLAFLAQLGLLYLLPRLGEPKSGPAGASDEAYKTMFDISHHDIWWAKEHAWTIITYVVGVVVTLVVVDMREVVEPERRAIGVLYLITAGLALFYVGRMQSDMAVSRIRSAFLVRKTEGLLPLVDHLVGDDRDYYRGSYFMLSLALLSSGVAAIAVAVLLKDRALGWWLTPAWLSSPCALSTSTF